MSLLSGSANQPTLPPGEGEGRGFVDPGTGFVAVLAIASTLLFGALLSVGILTLPLQANAIDAATSTTTIAIANGFAGIAALVLNPVIGRISDRTSSRWGRRRPYLVAGAVLVLLGGLVVVQAGSVLTLALGWLVMTLGQVAGLTALGALVPDLFSPERRGPVSALFGVAGTAGAVVGLFVASLFSPHLTPMVLVPAALAAVAMLVMAVVAPTAGSAAPAADPSHGAGLRAVVSTFWVSPRRYPDFALAFLSRFAVFCAIAAVNAYQAVYLIVDLHVDPVDVAGRVFLSTLVLGATALVFSTILGRVSDKVGRRKPFVIVSALIFAVGLALVASADSFGSFLVASAVMGLGQGVYLAVDFALITEVLPDPANPAKDLGIMNLAMSLPNIVVPVVAPGLLAIGAAAGSPGNFGLFFGVAAVVGLVGAVLIVPVRGAR
ncbi:MFS transporter [Nocardioides bruguierae]|uniref:MFS transporter n=1 Tax=Nocardioides bruguierae TaxID=2945102 RepID=A0A9X2D950_9ACTN|nr:MFS transporter [Nocardioides bruguierae]MCM0621436.1 MFS transporter [Nocardioides bruguierae]